MYVLLAFLLGSLSALAAPPIGTFLAPVQDKPPVHRGKKVPRPEADRHESACVRYLLLGHGLDGKVRRLRRRDGVVVRKDYADKSTRDSDYGLLQFYWEAQQAGLDTGFEIPRTWIEDRNKKYEFTGETFLFYEDIRGRELASLLIDPKVSDSLKTRLLTQYRSRLERWKTFVIQNWQGEVAQGYMERFDERRNQLEIERAKYAGDSLPSYLERDRALLFPYLWMQMAAHRAFDDTYVYRSGPIVLKADGIIVTPNGKMYLVDN